ncbi:MAG: UDP-N-acetylmuramoyl-tripeptide--D-alanyl-D-alanine ligase [Myxococcales bacterium]|nr:UDP-N-acetylmuramoyl-tripeptide--D-alanyl-D-alanine ligase [Myxococcales bacterium]USN51297.1 MAG: UDP-N-acetylmuramoyl-tripeptide--D-alanyl-D-alanine ligase [Myxococcales bacterium]
MQKISVDKKILAEVLASCKIDRLFEQEHCLLTIDSRAVPNGSLFFALSGETHDGHNYVKDALLRGAKGAVVKKNHPCCIDIDPQFLLEVEDPLSTLSQLAKRHIEIMPAIRIALSGSNGKTTTKEMLKAALSFVVGSEKVYANPGNKNNHIGLPLSAFELNKDHRYAIFEMGMNHSGEIAHLCQIVHPHFGLITNIGCAHEGNFRDGVLGVQKAKAELFDALKCKGHAIVNLDDPKITKEAQARIFACSTTFGTTDEAQVQLTKLEDFDEILGRQRLWVKIDGETFAVNSPLLGAHHAMNVLSTLATVKALGLDVKRASLGISNMTLIKGRMSISTNSRGCTIVNDGYNANPVSMSAGLLSAKTLKAKRFISVVGCMGELGEKSRQHHFELGILLAKHSARIFVCGTEGKAIVEGALSAGFLKEKIIYEETSLKLIDPLKNTLEKGDVVFIKGSLSANMQAIADALLQLDEGN